MGDKVSKPKPRKEPTVAEKPVTRLEDDPLFRLPTSEADYHEKLKNPRYLAALLSMEHHPGKPSLLCQMFCRKFCTGGSECELTRTQKFPLKGYCDEGFELIDGPPRKISEMIQNSWVMPDAAA